MHTLTNIQTHMTTEVAQAWNDMLCYIESLRDAATKTGGG